MVEYPVSARVQTQDRLRRHAYVPAEPAILMLCWKPVTTNVLYTNGKRLSMDIWYGGVGRIQVKVTPVQSK
jgi:hypothetical protein